MIIDNKRLGDYYISKITPFHVQKYQIQRKRELDIRFEKKNIAKEDRNYATVNRELACFKHMFNLAIEWEYIGKNPAVSTSVKFFPEKRRERFLSEIELQRLLNNSHGYLRNIILVALNTGMRSGEILNLKWKNVDLINNRILVTQTKTNKDRHIPINSFLSSILQSIDRKTDYLFYNRFGKPLGSIKKSFKTALNHSTILDFRFHDIRHTIATYLANDGVDEVTIAELLGHSRRTMTSRYSHSIWKRLVEAVEKIGESCHRYVTEGNIEDLEKENKSLNILQL